MAADNPIIEENSEKNFEDIPFYIMKQVYLAPIASTSHIILLQLLAYLPKKHYFCTCFF